MRLPKVNRGWAITASAVGLVAIFLIVDDLVKCHGRPLSRTEALQMATEHLRHTIVVDSPMPVVDEQYDNQKMWWTFTFRNAGCEVGVIVDRCSSDIGGITEGCKLRNGT